mgnify:CR=1 FL=1
MQFLQNSTSLSRIDRTRNTKLREGTKTTVTGTLADFGYERTPGWVGRVQKRVLRIRTTGIGANTKRRFWGCWGGFGALGLRGWAGAGQCCEFGPDWPISIWGQINTGFSFKWSWCVMYHWKTPWCFFPGSRPGRGARIPRAVLAGEGGLLVGYGGCGRPGLGLGCAESLPGVPRLYEY